VLIVVSVYFVIDSVRKLLDTHSYMIVYLHSLNSKLLEAECAESFLLWQFRHLNSRMPDRHQVWAF